MLTDWQPMLDHAGDFVRGTLLTAEVSVLAFVLAFALALLGAAGRRSPRRLPRVLAGTFVEVIRNTPVLLQVFVAYFALPSVGIPLSRFQAGVAALAVNAGAYLTEVLRSGIEAVPKGQREAAGVLALSEWASFRYVVMPQALRNVYPAVVNQFVQVILGTSLLSAIALPESDRHGADRQLGDAAHHAGVRRCPGHLPGADQRRLPGRGAVGARALPAAPSDLGTSEAAAASS